MDEPTTLRAGDTVSWTKSLSDYPASAGWLLKYRLLGTVNQTAVQAAADGDSFVTTITAAVSAAYTVDDYKLIGWVEKGTERHSIYEGTLSVIVNAVTAATGADTRSHARKTLALIEAAIESYAVRPVDEIDIAGRKLVRPSLRALLALKSQYAFFVKQEVMKERAANGYDPGGSILVKFGGIR